MRLPQERDEPSARQASVPARPGPTSVRIAVSTARNFSVQEISDTSYDFLPPPRQSAPLWNARAQEGLCIGDW